MILKDTKLSIHHTALCVNDFDRAKTFYVDFLGFTLEGEMDHRNEPPLGDVVGLPGAVIRWALLAHGSHRIELFKYYQPQGATDSRRQCDFGYTHLGFVVADVDAVYEQVMRAGYKVISPPKVLRNGASKAFYVREPEEAITEFVQFENVR